MGIGKLVPGLFAISLCVSQESEAQTLVTRFYNGKELESYSSDPLFCRYYAKGVSHSKSTHWLYRNHRYIFIDIEVNATDYQ